MAGGNEMLGFGRSDDADGTISIRHACSRVDHVRCWDETGLIEGQTATKQEDQENYVLKK